MQTAKTGMEGATAVRDELCTAGFSAEWVAQRGARPFRRIHRLDRPTLVYLPPDNRGIAQGCFQADAGDTVFRPFGLAVFVPRQVPLHVVSGGFAGREMLICRFDPERFEAVTGIGDVDETVLKACADVSAPAVLDMLERLAAEMRQAGIARTTIIAGLGLVLLGELGRYFAQVRTGGQREGILAPWQMRRIEERLAAGERPPPDIAELARLCGIGPRHLMRAFKATTGSTVGERIEHTLFARAARWLEGGDVPLKIIAARLGYRRAGSFSTAFRRRFGESPRDYRRRALAMSHCIGPAPGSARSSLAQIG
ncbi:MAG TPA: AraC family transcriptional regulator [Sphingomonas sp.]|nr:AraC family transcriptional regulator [Sphingomonas sp.]